MLRSHGTQLACQVCVHMKPTFQHEWKDNLLLLSKTSNVCQRSYCLEFLAPLQHGRHGWCWGGSGLWILLISTKASINKFPCLYVSIQRFSQYGDLHQLLLKPSLIWLSFQRYFHLSITQSDDLLSRISLRRKTIKTRAKFKELFIIVSDVNKRNIKLQENDQIILHVGFILYPLITTSTHHRPW